MLLLFACGESPIIEQIKETYPDNQPKVVEYVKGVDGVLEVVEQKTYYPNGQLKLAGKFNKGKRNGAWKAYFENGQTQSEGEFKNGVRTGIAKVYFPNGQIRYEGQYENDKEVGNWKFYNEKGKLVKEKDFN